MSQELKKIIREAFNNAYKNYTSKIISEAITGNVEQALKSVIANPEIAKRYAWVPQGSSNKALNQTEFNSFVNELYKMLSKTDLPKLKQIMLSLYGPDNTALYNVAKNQIISTLKTVPNEEDMVDSYLDGWNKIFLGNVETKTSKDNRHLNPEAQPEFYKNFDQFVAEYDPRKNPNFGSYISQVLQNAILDSYKFAIEDSNKKTSLDAPSRTTGKPTDVDSGEDFGSDALHAGSTEDTLRDFGGAFDDTENSASSSTDDLENVDSEFELSSDDESGNTLGSDLENDLGDSGDGSSNEKTAKGVARLMIKRLFKSLTEAISEFRQDENPTQNTEKAFLAIEKLMTGMRPKEASEALGYNATTALADLKKNKKFIKMIDLYLRANKFVNSRGKIDSFLNIAPIYISDAAKFLQTGEFTNVDLDARNNGASYADETDLSPDSPNSLKDMLKAVIALKKASKNLSNDSDHQVINSLLQGISPETINKKTGVNPDEVLNTLKANPAFEMFNKLTAQDVADAAKSIKAGKISKATPANTEEELQESTFWFLQNVIKEEVEMKKFISENITTIMENVYKKLAKNL